MTKYKTGSLVSEEAEELKNQTSIKNRNRVLYRNLRRLLNDARQYSDVVNYENELFCLKGVRFGVEERIAELEQKGVGLSRVLLSW